VISNQNQIKIINSVLLNFFSHLFSLQYLNCTKQLLNYRRSGACKSSAKIILQAKFVSANIWLIQSLQVCQVILFSELQKAQNQKSNHKSAK
jgi:hypothetical protein